MIVLSHFMLNSSHKSAMIPTTKTCHTFFDKIFFRLNFSATFPMVLKSASNFICFYALFFKSDEHFLQAFKQNARQAAQTLKNRLLTICFIYN